MSYVAHRWERVLLYGSTVFLSSFLLFLIQPIVAKLILPWFGGSAAVWTTCLVFFQTALLLGYLYAHVVVRRLSPLQQTVLHSVLLAGAIFLMPVIPAPTWKSAAPGDPTWRILGLLSVVLGLPYVLLSTTSPLLQSWYARLDAKSQPYRLFALSNAAALVALIAYPFLIEPKIPTRTQDVLWSGAFAAFAILCAAAAWIGLDKNATVRSVAAESTAGQTAAWVALATVGSMLLVSTTNQITQNVAAVPFLWILPLAVYLLTFILCFESHRWYRRGLFLRLLAVALGSVAYAVFDIQTSDTVSVALPLFTSGLFVMCMFCHGELNRQKPEAGGLTAFYLTIAAGGALGAILAGLVAPRIFSGIYELPVTLFFVAVLALWVNWREGWAQRLLWTVATVAMIVTVVEVVSGFRANTLVMMRSFYGALRVIQVDDVRTLYHGTVKHGSEFVTAGRRDDPTSYYGPLSGGGLALRYCREGPKRVGIVGLGAGTLAAYGQPGDRFRFYEINPQVIELANSQFFYLHDTRAAIEIEMGDARLSLESGPPQAFDVLVLDAFSGDAVPVHLLTKEAFALYTRHLAPGGILALHVSNQYLDLAPVAGQLAANAGYPVYQVISFGDNEHMISAAVWILMTRNQAFLSRPEIARAVGAIPERPEIRLWTDDYNNLFQVMRWKR